MRTRFLGGSCYWMMAALAVLLGPGSVSGQDFDVAAVMRCHEKDVLRSQLELSERSFLHCGTPVHYLTPGAYPQATVEAVLDGLVDVALTSTHRSVQVGAVALIGHYGGYRAPEGVIDVERPSQVERLSRLLSDGAWHVRGAAMGALMWQPDRAAAARALAQVLTRAASPPFPSGSGQHSLENRALGLLWMMGPEGKAALRQLLADDAIPTPWIPAASAVAARPPR